MPRMTAGHDPIALAVGAKIEDDITDPPVPEDLSAKLREAMRQTPGALPTVQAPGKDPTSASLHLLREAITDSITVALEVPLANGLAQIDGRIKDGLRTIDTTLAAGVQTMVTREIFNPPAPLVPYSCTISAIAPSGFPMSFTIQAETQARFIEQAIQMLGFMKQEGFTPHKE